MSTEMKTLRSSWAEAPEGSRRRQKNPRRRARAEARIGVDGFEGVRRDPVDDAGAVGAVMASLLEKVGRDPEGRKLERDAAPSGRFRCFGKPGE
jgi:hypothetical protein